MISKPNNMYRAVLFAVLIAVVSAQDEKCRGIFGPRAMHCCATLPKPSGPPPPPPAELKECFELHAKPPSCAREDCIAKKKGFYKDDGSLDKTALAADLQNEFSDHPDIATSIKDNCIDGDISKFGPPDMCDLMKFRNCLHAQLLTKCTEWSDKDDCSGMKELVEQCAKGFV